jgi:hypothetical protein
MIFIHGKMPVFRNEEEMYQALSITEDLFGADWDTKWMSPTWENDDWGMYARRAHWTGYSHYMIPILRVIDELKSNWQNRKDDEDWKSARKFFKHLRYVKQTFGASWLCKVSYTLPVKGELDEDVMGLPGINIIDLEETGDLLDEQTEKTPMGAH